MNNDRDYKFEYFTYVSTQSLNFYFIKKKIYIYIYIYQLLKM